MYYKESPRPHASHKLLLDFKTHRYIHTYTHTYMHTYIHTYTHIHAYMYCKQSPRPHASPKLLLDFKTIHTCTHTYTHAYTHTYMHTYIHTYTHIHAYMYCKQSPRPHASHKSLLDFKSDPCYASRFQEFHGGIFPIFHVKGQYIAGD
jgi:hypothetical protein